MERKTLCRSAKWQKTGIHNKTPGTYFGGGVINNSSVTSIRRSKLIITWGVKDNEPFAATYYL